MSKTQVDISGRDNKSHMLACGLVELF